MFQQIKIVLFLGCNNTDQKIVSRKEKTYLTPYASKNIYLQGLHQRFCWSSPYLALHFFMLAAEIIRRLENKISCSNNICFKLARCFVYYISEQTLSCLNFSVYSFTKTPLIWNLNKKLKRVEKSVCPISRWSQRTNSSLSVAEENYEF